MIIRDSKRRVIIYRLPRVLCGSKHPSFPWVGLGDTNTFTLQSYVRWSLLQREKVDIPYVRSDSCLISFLLLGQADSVRWLCESSRCRGSTNCYNRFIRNPPASVIMGMSLGRAFSFYTFFNIILCFVYIDMRMLRKLFLNTSCGERVTSIICILLT